jgi:hypothetical protein
MTAWRFFSQTKVEYYFERDCSEIVGGNELTLRLIVSFIADSFIFPSNSILSQSFNTNNTEHPNPTDKITTA